MSSISLKATVVPGTGTGKVFDAYNCVGNQAIYRENAPVASAGIILLGRTEAKPSSGNNGVTRGQVKLTRQVPDALGIPHPVILDIRTSLPSFMTDVAKAAFVDEGILLATEAVARDVLSKLLIPQA